MTYDHSIATIVQTRLPRALWPMNRNTLCSLTYMRILTNDNSDFARNARQINFRDADVEFCENLLFGTGVGFAGAAERKLVKA